MESNAQSEAMRRAGEELGRSLIEGLNSMDKPVIVSKPPRPWWRRILGLRSKYPDFNATPIWRTDPSHSPKNGA